MGSFAKKPHNILMGLRFGFRGGSIGHRDASPKWEQSVGSVGVQKGQPDHIPQTKNNDTSNHPSQVCAAMLVKTSCYLLHTCAQPPCQQCAQQNCLIFLNMIKRHVHGQHAKKVHVVTSIYKSSTPSPRVSEFEPALSRQKWSWCLAHREQPGRPQEGKLGSARCQKTLHKRNGLGF